MVTIIDHYENFGRLGFHGNTQYKLLDIVDKEEFKSKIMYFKLPLNSYLSKEITKFTSNFSSLPTEARERSITLG
jgi:hypothetical protein